MVENRDKVERETSFIPGTPDTSKTPSAGVTKKVEGVVHPTGTSNVREPKGSIPASGDKSAKPFSSRQLEILVKKCKSSGLAFISKKVNLENHRAYYLEKIEYDPKGEKEYKITWESSGKKILQDNYSRSDLEDWEKLAEARDKKNIEAGRVSLEALIELNELVKGFPYELPNKEKVSLHHIEQTTAGKFRIFYTLEKNKETYFEIDREQFDKFQDTIEKHTLPYKLAELLKDIPVELAPKKLVYVESVSTLPAKGRYQICYTENEKDVICDISKKELKRWILALESPISPIELQKLYDFKLNLLGDIVDIESVEPLSYDLFKVIYKSKGTTAELEVPIKQIHAWLKFVEEKNARKKK